jgi:hypothetical protein
MLVGGTQGFRGAGVSPAIFLITIHCKNAGETPAPQQFSRVNQPDFY